MSAAFDFFAKTCVSSIIVPTGLPPVTTSVSAALICSTAPVVRCVIVRMCRWIWNSLSSSGSIRMVPIACLNAMLAIWIVGAIRLNSPSGRRFMMSAVSITAPPFDDLALPFGMSRKNSWIIRTSRSGS